MRDGSLQGGHTSFNLFTYFDCLPLFSFFDRFFLFFTLSFSYLLLAQVLLEYVYLVRNPSSKSITIVVQDADEDGRRNQLGDGECDQLNEALFRGDQRDAAPRSRDILPDSLQF